MAYVASSDAEDELDAEGTSTLLGIPLWLTVVMMIILFLSGISYMYMRKRT